MFYTEFAIWAAEAERQQRISKQQDPKGSDHLKPYKLSEFVQIEVWLTW